jgi:hypothetical protein
VSFSFILFTTHEMRVSQITPKGGLRPCKCAVHTVKRLVQVIERVCVAEPRERMAAPAGKVSVIKNDVRHFGIDSGRPGGQECRGAIKGSATSHLVTGGCTDLGLGGVEPR